MQNSIVVITCWYGKYPWYLPYYLHSCAFNPSIDFIIITDNKEKPDNVPENVKIINRTLNDIINSTSEKLGFKINIDYPYKLCDFKPAYGFMFPEIIKDYTFWGHCDLDLIYGDIRGFMTEEFLDAYDYISLRDDYTTGCFSLYRNTELLNNFFMKSKDYQQVFSQPKHYCFDECNFAWTELDEGHSIFDIDTEIVSFTHIMKQAEMKKTIRTHFDFILMEGFTGKVKFENGKIIYKNKIEAIMFHMFWLKKVYNPVKVPKKIPNSYKISPTRIYW
ncbi:hypothetical protein QF023_002812 [Chryseobacterium sp. SLBN-27]|uniref:DUF6625 family protein n=1 Tax=Chryseobacterium sp. SLBN-27 TaxID=3042287 RepID=UPI00285695B2|nr:DUF6625 family protein [Chryseobacterium sp. SLBN-27]MDR6159296.1 hypothetical protein [Chryseobacterium sp. SLBN-27]